MSPKPDCTVDLMKKVDKYLITVTDNKEKLRIWNIKKLNLLKEIKFNFKTNYQTKIVDVFSYFEKFLLVCHNRHISLCSLDKIQHIFSKTQHQFLEIKPFF